MQRASEAVVTIILGVFGHIARDVPAVLDAVAHYDGRGRERRVRYELHCIASAQRNSATSVVRRAHEPAVDSLDTQTGRCVRARRAV